MAEPEGAGGPEKTPPRPWTPEEIQSFVGVLATAAERLGDKYIAFSREKWLHEVAMENATSKADWKVLAILMLFLGVVIALMVGLVLAGRVSGDALLFLVGTVSGYIFALVQRHLFPETVEVTPQA